MLLLVTENKANAEENGMKIQKYVTEFDVVEFAD